jgi:hypothetical protein
MTKSPGPSDSLKQFIVRHINSVEQVEVLLLLKRSSPREWTAEAVSREISTSRYSAEGRLMNLQTRGLIALREEDHVLHFWYDAANPHGPLIDELAKEYLERRTTIITMIFAPRSDSVTTFAQAFDLRNSPKDQR